jgi:predicted transcriptional regulator
MKKMHLKNIHKLIEQRDVLSKNLYPGHTLITYDLILDILKAHLEGKSLSIKELCAESIKSTLNTRKHLNQLRDGGWVEFSNGIHDKRLRQVTATEQLIHLVDKLLEQ